MNWPEHLPENCPPPKAKDATGEVFRLVNHNSPHPDDFRSWREDNISKVLPQGMTECQAGGLSVFRDKTDICHLIKRIPRLRKAKPASGIISDLGKILPTPSKGGQSHHTWWVPMNTQPWNIFQIVSID